MKCVLGVAHIVALALLSKPHHNAPQYRALAALAITGQFLWGRESIIIGLFLHTFLKKYKFSFYWRLIIYSIVLYIYTST